MLFDTQKRLLRKQNKIRFGFLIFQKDFITSTARANRHFIFIGGYLGRDAANCRAI